MDNHDAHTATWAPPVQLQFGHGGEPWITSCSSMLALLRAVSLQFGHGGEPWITRAFLKETPRVNVLLQFGHGGEPWITKIAEEYLRSDH